MSSVRFLLVGLLLAVQPAQAMLATLCRAGDRHPAGHCTVQVQSDPSLMRITAASEGAGCTVMPACREPGPSLFAGDWVKAFLPNPFNPQLPGVSELYSVAGERPPTPPPNG